MRNQESTIAWDTEECSEIDIELSFTNSAANAPASPPPASPTQESTIAWDIECSEIDIELSFTNSAANAPASPPNEWADLDWAEIDLERSF